MFLPVCITILLAPSWVTPSSVLATPWSEGLSLEYECCVAATAREAGLTACCCCARSTLTRPPSLPAAAAETLLIPPLSEARSPIVSYRTFYLFISFASYYYRNPIF